jgi:hypothetical protein
MADPLNGDINQLNVLQLIQFIREKASDEYQNIRHDAKARALALIADNNVQINASHLKKIAEELVFLRGVNDSYQGACDLVDIGKKIIERNNALLTEEIQSILRGEVGEGPLYNLNYLRYFIEPNLIYVQIGDDVLGNPVAANGGRYISRKRASRKRVSRKRASRKRVSRKNKRNGTVSRYRS